MASDVTFWVWPNDEVVFIVVLNHVIACGWFLTGKFAVDTGVFFFFFGKTDDFFDIVTKNPISESSECRSSTMIAFSVICWICFFCAESRGFQQQRADR